MRSFALTDRGRRRPHNEDAYLSDDALGLYAVADGVGGNAMGEVASAETVEQIQGYVRQGRATLDRARAHSNQATHEEVRRLLESAVQSACYLVYGMGEQDPASKGMSTTLSALLLSDGWAVTAQVGDSRVYLVRAGSGVQITEDHTLLNYQLKKGLITEEQARRVKKNVITRAVGYKDYVEVDTRVIGVEAGDLFMLCSDGLHGYLADGEVERVVAAGPLEEAPARLVALANDRGGKDNITVVLVAA